MCDVEERLHPELRCSGWRRGAALALNPTSSSSAWLNVSQPCVTDPRLARSRLQQLVPTRVRWLGSTMEAPSRCESIGLRLKPVIQVRDT